MILGDAYRKHMDFQHVSIGNMVRLTRRHALQIGSGALLGAFAGCSTFSQEPAPDLSLRYIHALNKTPTARTLHVLILLGDEPVYSASREMPPHEQKGPDDFIQFDRLPETVEDHVLYAWRDSQPTAEWSRFDFTEIFSEHEFDDNSDACIGLFIRITNSVLSDQKGEITIYGGPVAEGCPNRTSEDAN